MPEGKSGSAQTCHRNSRQKEKESHILWDSKASAGGATYSSQNISRQTDAQRTATHNRSNKFSKAVRFAYSQDWPLIVSLTISWDALILVGDHNEGNCLWRPPWDREGYLRKELRRLCRRHERTFACLWGRDVGRDIGEHVHLSMFWPSAEVGAIISLIERITGSPAAFVAAPYTTNPLARSVCGGWQFDLNTRHLKGALDWALYISQQHEKHPRAPELKGKAFGISQAIHSAAQRRSAFN